MKRILIVLCLLSAPFELRAAVASKDYVDNMAAATVAGMNMGAYADSVAYANSSADAWNVQVLDALNSFLSSDANGYYSCNLGFSLIASDSSILLFNAMLIQKTGANAYYVYGDGNYSSIANLARLDIFASSGAVVYLNGDSYASNALSGFSSPIQVFGFIKR